MCKQKGFDGVEADNVEGYELETGFELTAAEQLTYNEWLANTAHSLGLSIALKNDRNQVSELEPYFDFALDEECFQSEECGKLAPFIDAGKAVFETEYSLETSEFCEQANAAGFMAMKKEPKLTATRTPCWPQAQGDWVGAKGSSGYDLAAWEGSGDVELTCPTPPPCSPRAAAACGRRRRPKRGPWKARRAPAARRQPTSTRIRLKCSCISARHTKGTSTCMRSTGTRAPAARRSPWADRPPRSPRTSPRAPGSPSRSSVGAGETRPDHGRPHRRRERRAVGDLPRRRRVSADSDRRNRARR